MVRYFLEGYARMAIYYSPFAFLIRKRLRNKFAERLKKVDKECYSTGSCKKCGCDVPAILFSDKSCPCNDNVPLFPDVPNEHIRTDNFTDAVGNTIRTMM